MECESTYDICHFCVKRKLCYTPFCWQRDKDGSENWSVFLILLSHEGLLAFTRIHIHPEVPSSKMEDAKEKGAVNAKMNLCTALCDLEEVMFLLASVFSFVK